jgi:type II secretory pathway predicted ATPase ExeA
MTTFKQLASLGLKHNPFSSDVPIDALTAVAATDHFCWRIESMVSEGGFAFVTGDPGTGKSVTLRMLERRLSVLRDVPVATLTHPRSRLGDFYRELGDLFGAAIVSSNRYGGFKTMRARWLSHIDASLVRPVLLIDEAQQMYPEVLSELRVLASSEFDSRTIITVVLAGDNRLVEMLRTPELLPLGTRIRARLTLEHHKPDELQRMLAQRLEQCGNAALMAPAVIRTLAEHAAGNPRVLMTTANELLDAAIAREQATIDEKLYFDVFHQPVATRAPASPRARR